MHKHSMIGRTLKAVLWFLEAFLFLSLIWIFFILPYAWASYLGGLLFKSVGPLFRVNRVAHKNISFVFPEMDLAERDRIIKGMWENMGRTFIEYLRLAGQDPFAPKSPYTIKGLEHIDGMIQDGMPGMLLTIHQANWQLGTYVAQKRGLNLAQVTRFLNNPLMRVIINHIHYKVATDIIPKGSHGGRRIVEVMKKGGHVSMMMDQKLSDGIEVPFFGKGAMTASAMAKLALKYDAPIVPVQVVRTRGVASDIIFYPPLVFDLHGSDEEKIYQMLLVMNQTIERFVRAHPDQWFWVHRRWPKDFYKERKTDA